jgi:hypothetical protein
VVRRGSSVGNTALAVLAHRISSFGNTALAVLARRVLLCCWVSLEQKFQWWWQLSWHCYSQSVDSQHHKWSNSSSSSSSRVCCLALQGQQCQLFDGHGQLNTRHASAYAAAATVGALPITHVSECAVLQLHTLSCSKHCSASFRFQYMPH